VVFHNFGNMQLRILSRRHSSSRNPKERITQGALLGKAADAGRRQLRQETSLGLVTSLRQWLEEERPWAGFRLPFTQLRIQRKLRKVQFFWPAANL
jgi:hypothetical protein